MLEGYFIESVMIVPVKRGNTTVAMLEIIHDKDNKTFSSEDREQAEAFTEKLEPLTP